MLAFNGATFCGIWKLSSPQLRPLLWPSQLVNLSLAKITKQKLL